MAASSAETVLVTTAHHVNDSSAHFVDEVEYNCSLINGSLVYANNGSRLINATCEEDAGGMYRDRRCL